MAQSLTGSIVRGWGAPRAAMASQMADGLTEPRALVHLIAACGLFCLASLPNAIRTAARLEIDDALSGAIAAHVFGFLILAPLLAYAAAALIQLIARAAGGRSGFLATRAAFFWSLLLAAPIALAVSLAGVVGEALAGPEVLPAVSLLGYAGLAVWLWLFAASLAEAQGFAATGRVAVCLGVAFAGIAAIFAVLANGSATAG